MIVMHDNSVTVHAKTVALCREYHGYELVISNALVPHSPIGHLARLYGSKNWKQPDNELFFVDSALNDQNRYDKGIRQRVLKLGPTKVHLLCKSCCCLSLEDQLRPKQSSVYTCHLCTSSQYRKITSPTIFISVNNLKHLLSKLQRCHLLCTEILH